MVATVKDKTMVNLVNNTSKLSKINESKMVLSKHNPFSTEPSQPTSNEMELSAESKQLQAIKLSLQQIPEVNQTLVAFFKNQIASGTYVIHSDTIAKNMLQISELA